MKKFICLAVAFLSLLSPCQAYSFEDWEETVDEEDNTEAENLDNQEDEIAGKVFLEEEFLDGDLLKISARISELNSPVLGLSFYLNFDQNKLAFLRYEPGNFLEQGGNPFYLVQEQNDKIVFGETLRHDDRFPINQGDVANFYFQTLADDSFEFKFENGVVSTLDVTRQDLNKIIWENKIVSKNNSSVIADYLSKTSDSVISLPLAKKWAMPVASIFFFVGLILVAKFIKNQKSANRKSPNGYVNFK